MSIIDNIGNRIKYYREKRGISQFSVEVDIGASPGSLSRIEANKVNPTRNTLSKIAMALKLRPSETADILGITLITPEELISAIIKVSSAYTLERTLQTAVDILFDLYPEYNGGVLLLLDDKDKDRLFSQTVSNMPKIEQVFKILPRPINELNVSLKKDRYNLVVKSINENTAYESEDLFDFVIGTMPQTISRMITSILGFKRGIVFPMSTNEVIGAIFYTKNTNNPFTPEEQRILGMLTDQLAIIIKNSKEKEGLQKQIDRLKKKLK